MKFAPYEVRGPLGRGGMGEVYRAWDPRLQREVALKVLHERTDTDPDRIRQFVAEARAASALSHPNILTVFDADVDGSTPFIVSELIEGASLREEIRRGPLPLKRVLDLGTQIADGLSEAHAAGIVHRDLKPENIMITRGGRAKILDFGLTQPTGLRGARDAKTVDGDTMTEPGLIAGTVPYMSPEQARGLPTDFRTDQFSFGLVLYEMLTGQPAFRRATAAATLDAIANEDPVPLTAQAPPAPVMLRWIVERCLAKNPAERYSASADLYHDLRTLRDRLSETMDRERPAGQRERSASLGARLAVGALMVAAAAAGFIAWQLGAHQPWFNETKMLGARDGSARTEEQTQIAIFWDGSPSATWNSVARGVIHAKSLDLSSAARAFALMYIAGADASIACFDAKYTYNFWRPITAIHRADEDGNDATVRDLTWQSLITTHPHPEYPSGHSTNSSAMATTLAFLFGDDPGVQIVATSPRNTTFPRYWSTFSEGVDEVIDACVHIGFHFRNSDATGARVGRMVARFVFNHALRG